MKKFLFFSIAVIAMLASCTKNEPIEPTATNDPIGFGTYLSQSTTRGAVVNSEALQTSGFGVYAAVGASATGWTSSCKANFMTNTKVEYASSAWSYTGVRYWPESDSFDGALQTVSFWGYAPYSTDTGGTGKSTVAVGADLTNGGYPYLDYTLTADAANQLDLTAATAMNKTKNDGTVQMQFKHILSRVGFAAKYSGTLTNTSIKVTSLNVYYKNSKIFNKARYNFDSSVGAWDLTNNDPTKFTGGTYQTNYLLAEDVNTTDVTLTTTALQLNAASKYMMLIPQSIDKGDLIAVIGYDVIPTDNTEATTHNTKVIELPAGTFEMGQAYRYVFTVSLTAVDVEGSVTNWGDDVDVVTVSGISNVEAAITAAANKDVDVTITSEVTGSNTITIPTSQTTGDVTLNFSNIDSDAQITITSTNNALTGDLNINVPTGTTATQLTITSPNAHVTVNGGEWTNVAASTSSSTLVVGAGCTITTLTVSNGNVKVFGTITNAIKATNATTNSQIFNHKSGQTLTISATASEAYANIHNLSSWSGTGTATDPFVIDDATELGLLATAVNAGYNSEGEYYQLSADITLSTETDWTPIGTEANPFKGTFDGNGKAISNLKIVNSTSTGWGIGLFGYINGATVKGCTLASVNIDCTASASNAAGFAGIAIDSYLTGLEVASGTIKASRVAGIVGDFQLNKDPLCYVSDCINRANLTMYGTGKTFRISGGIIQQYECFLGQSTMDVHFEKVFEMVRRCTNYGTITVDATNWANANTTYMWIGQIVGSNSYASTAGKSSTYDYYTLKLTECKALGSIVVTNYIKSTLDDNRLCLTGSVNGTNTTYLKTDGSISMNADLIKYGRIHQGISVITIENGIARYYEATSTGQTLVE